MSPVTFGDEGVVLKAAAAVKRSDKLAAQVAEAANDWPLARKQLRAHRSEIRPLRTVIRTGGAAYRLERAAMGIPGVIDAEGQPIAKAEGGQP